MFSPEHMTQRKEKKSTESLMVHVKSQHIKLTSKKDSCLNLLIWLSWQLN